MARQVSVSAIDVFLNGKFKEKCILHATITLNLKPQTRSAEAFNPKPPLGTGILLKSGSLQWYSPKYGILVVYFLGVAAGFGFWS